MTELNGNEFYHYDKLLEDSILPNAAQVAWEEYLLQKEYPAIDWAIEEYFHILERDAEVQNKVAASHLRAMLYGIGAASLGGVMLPVGVACAALAGSWFFIKK